MGNQPDTHFESYLKLKEFLLNSIEGIIDLIGTLDHHKRLEILIQHLGEQSVTFSDLLEHTQLQKSALSNHLAVLVDRGLIEKKEKGIYQISIDGEELLHQIAQIYLNTKIREQERLVRLFELIGTKKTEGELMSKSQQSEVLSVVNLPPTRVVSFHAMGIGLGNPEPKAWDKLIAWAKPLDLFNNPQMFQIYGFNNPCPPSIDEKTEYGYELWITIPDDFETDDEVTIKNFSGGLYATIMCRGVSNLMVAYKKLAELIKNCKSYQFDCSREWLERTFDAKVTNGNEVLFELYGPISEKSQGK